MIVETNILDNATLWVAISFIIFIILVFKPIKGMMLTNLDNKIAELKSQLNESKKLKEMPRNFTEHNKKYKETLIKIKKINEDAIYESKIIKMKVEEDIKNSFYEKKRDLKHYPHKWNSK